jgi:hypothetical protein
MDANHHIWRGWAMALHRWGLQDTAADLLEAASPFTLLAAQAVYLGQPILNSIMPAGHSQALAEVLEEGVNREAFISFLRAEDLG